MRSGSASNDFTLLQSCRCTDTPAPRVTNPTISSPGTTSGAVAKLEHAATGALSYQLNPWLRLRASAGWSMARYEGIDTRENKWGVGVGADYLLNEHTDLTADYSFERSETTPEPATDEHQVTVGVRFHR